MLTRFRRQVTRRARLRRRRQDVLGRLWWSVARWWARGIGGELRRTMSRATRR